MKKTTHSDVFPRNFRKIIIIMNLTVLLVIISTSLAFSTNIYSQKTKLSLNLNKVTVKEVFQAIEEQSEFIFFYQDQQLNLNRNVDINVEQKTIEEILNKLFENTSNVYRIDDRQIVIGKIDIKLEKELPLMIKKNSESQQPERKDISGRVIDKNGEPLLGVTVIVQGTTIGTITDRDGRFLLSIPRDAKVLEFRFIGMKTEQFTIGEQTIFNVTLTEEAVSLEDVIVVSYGTQLRREVTGSILQLGTEELRDMPVGQFAQKLQGKFAGLQIHQTTGRPGQGMAFRIRGAASINAGNTPLFVVDGQPLDDYGDVNNINPDEIETFTVLKDAAATALYGSRATNGVIMITTKQAKPGKTTIDFNAYYALAALDKSHIPPMMNAREFAQWMKEYLEDKIIYENWKQPGTGLAEVPDVYKNPEQYGEGTNWLDRVIRVAPTQSYNLSFNDYRDKSSTALIAGYFNQDGIVKNTSYERFSVRVNNEFRPTEKLRIWLNLAPTYAIDHNSSGIDSDGQRRIIEGALLSSPIESPFNEDGSLANQASSYYSLPLCNYELKALHTKDIRKSTRLLGNLILELDLFKGLKFKTRADVDLRGSTRDYFLDRYAAGAFNRVPPRPVNEIRGIYSTSNSVNWLNENILTYQTNFLANHKIDVLAGYTIQKRTNFSNSAEGSNFADEEIEYISAAGTTTATSSTSAWSLISMIGRVNYSYKGKYLLAGSIRRDGSSRFGFDKKYGVFPSVSAGWIISEEPFLSIVPVISYLKIRASYGITGNNNIGNYPSQSLIGEANYVFGNTLTPGKAVSQLGNSLLSWEKNKQFDIGVDIGIIKDRLTLTYDYYNKLTDGLLYQINIPRASGFSSVSENIGTFKFWGHEFYISSRNLIRTLKWNTDFYITFDRSRVEKLGTEDLPIIGNDFNQPWIVKVGQPVCMFWGYVMDGVYMTQEEFDTQPKHSSSMVGSARAKDTNKDGVIDADDRTFIGNPNPDFIIGLTNELRYKNFDLNIVFSGAIGCDIFDGLGESSMNLDGAFNVYNWIKNKWRSEEDPGDGIVPRTYKGTTTMFRRMSNNKIHNGSYLTCKNISLGYSFKLPYDFFMTKLRCYFSVQQAFVITPYFGFNPEVGRDGDEMSGTRLGSDNTNYPVPRTFSFGINVSL